MPTHNPACVALLEKILWGKKAKCPYCGSTHAAPLRKEQRYHCNTCFTSYSATVGTVFHGTRVDLAKWFRAIQLMYNASGKTITTRKLARSIKVNKDTAALMMKRLQEADESSKRLVRRIADELQTSSLLEDLEKRKDVN